MDTRSRFVSTPTAPPVQGRLWKRRVPAPPLHPQPSRFICSPSAAPTRGRLWKRRPPYPAWVEYAQTFEQGHRVEDTSFDLYELYVGEDAPPDFEALDQPVETSATLPFTWAPTPPPSGTKTLYVVVRKRNAYYLQSFNVYATKVVIGTLGEQLLADPSPPLDIETYDDVLGSVRVIATYLSTEDPSPADTWEIFATEGADPDPDVDSPAYSGAMKIVGEQAFLGKTISGYTPGSALHIIVTAKRASDSAYGAAAVVQHVLTTQLSLDAGDLFGGEWYEQR
jgi:hypothetical protein